MRTALRTIGWLLPLLLLLGAALRLRTSNDAPDDAFITLRYVQNLVGGEGFRYNPGGERVEGFSSPLNVLLLAALHLVGIPLELASQLLSLVSALGLVLWTGWLGRRLLGIGWGSLLACGLALSPALAFWSRGGLETTLTALLVVAAMDLVLRGRLAGAFLAAGLLAIVRPEGLLYGAVLTAWLIADHARTRGFASACRHAARPVLLAALIPSGWFVFRLAYFGELLPNTYYAKMDGVRLAQVERGLDYVGRWASRAEIEVPLLFAVVGLGCAAARWLGRRRASSTSAGPTTQRAVSGVDGPATWILLAAAFSAATLAFAVLAGGDHLDHFRFLLPALAPVQLLGTWGCRTLFAMLTRAQATPLLGRAALAVLLGWAFLSQELRIAAHEIRHPRDPLDRPWRLVEERDESHICSFYDLGLALRGRASADASIAVVPAGAIAYSSGMIVVDMLGLNDREIAHLPVDDMGSGHVGHEKGRGDVVLRRRPTYILLNHRPQVLEDGPLPPTPEDLGFVPVRELWESPDFHDRYDPVLVPIDAERGYTVHRLEDEADDSGG